MHQLPEYASPRSSLASPGLTHRGKTPRSSGLSEEHTHFQFDDYAYEVRTTARSDDHGYGGD